MTRFPIIMESTSVRRLAHLQTEDTRQIFKDGSKLASVSDLPYGRRSDAAK